MTEYSFDPFLEALSGSWYEDDALFRRLLVRHAAAPDEERLVHWGRRCAGELRELAEESALPGNAPRLRQFDPVGRRVDEVLLPASTRAALAAVEGEEGLGAPHGDPFEFYAKIYLYAQNGEAGVACSAACTDGLVRALEALGAGPEHREAVERVRGSTPERVWHGAQFVTEIQGGSDVPANRTRAVPEGDGYRLHGRKWFCSNVNADYFLVTAQPEGVGAEPLGLFLVPAYLREGDWRRNGYTIDRLKEKLGTRELATAEVTFDGAVAWAVGPLERGLPNLLRYVLVPSRFACVVFAAAALRRAERIVGAYSEFRTAFGRRLIDYPLVKASVLEISRTRARALASVFRLLAAWEATGERPGGGRERPGGRGEAGDSDDLLFRVMLSLCKTVLTREATRLLHEAMMLLGGNGIEERFSPLPRLYRDAAIMETWEGPHNVLLTQALRDLRRFGPDPEAFVEAVTGEATPDLAAPIRRLLAEEEEGEAAVRFAPLAERLVSGWADRVLAEVAEVRETVNP